MRFVKNHEKQSKVWQKKVIKTREKKPKFRKISQKFAKKPIIW